MGSYLVTGGCGFIGSHLGASLLADGHRVRVLDDLSTGKHVNLPHGAELLVGDVADPDAVSRAMDGVDGCFHLAAVASVELGNQDWLGTHRTNLTGTITVFNAARQRSGALARRVVYASSAAIYGDNPEMPLKETAAPRPLSAYGADKLGCEQHALVAGRVHAVPTFGLRFFNVYGSRQDPASPYSGVISIFCDRLKAGRGITIFGDGRQIRDFIHVSDVVRAMRTAMNRASIEAEVCNVCTGRATSVQELAEMIAGVLNASLCIENRPARAGEIRQSIGDLSKAREVLGFKAALSLRDGLARTVATE